MAICPADCQDLTITPNPLECEVKTRFDNIARIGFYTCDTEIPDPITEVALTAFVDAGKMAFSSPLANVVTNAPAGFTATPFVGPEIQLTWTNDTNADAYEIERALDAGFTMSLTSVYSGAYVSSHVDTVGLLGGTTYYYRIKATKSGFPDSPFSYDDATTP